MRACARARGGTACAEQAAQPPPPPPPSPVLLAPTNSSKSALSHAHTLSKPSLRPGRWAAEEIKLVKKERNKLNKTRRHPPGTFSSFSRCTSGWCAHAPGARRCRSAYSPLPCGLQGEAAGRGSMKNVSE